MFYDNLKAACEAKGVKITPIVNECGGAKGSISNWKNGATPNSDIVAKLAVRLNVSTDFLIFGKEKSIELAADEQELLEYYHMLCDINKGKVIGTAKTLAELENSVYTYTNNQEEKDTIFIEYSTLKVSAGAGEPLIDDSHPEFIEVKRNELTEDANFAVQINGNSMEPYYEDDDIVLVKSQPEVAIGQVGIFIINNEGFIKKRGSDRLISLNPECKDIYFEEGQEIWCKGLVIGILEEEDII